MLVIAQTELPVLLFNLFVDLIRCELIHLGPQIEGRLLI